MANENKKDFFAKLSIITQKGRKNIRYYVKDYEKALFSL